MYINLANLYVVPTGIISLSVWLQSIVKEVAVLAGICTSETLFIDGVLVVSASSTFVESSLSWAISEFSSSGSPDSSNTIPFSSVDITKFVTEPCAFPLKIINVKYSFGRYKAKLSII